MTHTIDETAKRFLSVTDEKDVTILPGQTADQKKIDAARSKELLDEASYFGDIMVKYVVKHPDLTPEQRAWGFMLGLLCVRQDYPEGVATFDELADAGGADLVLDIVTKSPEDAMTTINIDALHDSESFNKAAQFAELFAKYVAKTKRSLNTSNSQTAYGLGRAMHNLRLSFLEEKGGPAGFDYWASQAGEYFRTR